MPFKITFHYDNRSEFHQPYLWIWYAGSPDTGDFEPSGQDAFGFVYNVEVKRLEFNFKFKDGSGVAGPWEGASLDRRYRHLKSTENGEFLNEIWCRGDKAFLYSSEPKAPEPISAGEFLQQLEFKAGVYVPDTGGISGLGANLLKDGRVLLGFYHPNAGRVYVMGSFNDWQRPGVDQPDETKFIEMNLYRGYFNIPNIWLVVSDKPKIGDEYKFCVQGGVPSDEKGRLQQYFTDPYARQLGKDYGFNNSVIIDPIFSWSDGDWVAPDISQLIIYELSVYGFTGGDPDIDPANQGKFRGIRERIQSGYFNQLGVTALSLMPLAEVSSMQGATSLGYDPSLFLSVERDFGTPDDLRELVNSAHEKGLAVLIDAVFNHTSNDFNPLYKMILEHPNEEDNPLEGGCISMGERLGQ